MREAVLPFSSQIWAVLFWGQLGDGHWQPVFPYVTPPGTGQMATFDFSLWAAWRLEEMCRTGLGHSYSRIYTVLSNLKASCGAVVSIKGESLVGLCSLRSENHNHPTAGSHSRTMWETPGPRKRKNQSHMHGSRTRTTAVREISKVVLCTWLSLSLALSISVWFVCLVCLVCLVWSVCLVGLSGWSVWSVCLVRLSGPSVWSVCLVRLSGQSVRSVVCSVCLFCLSVLSVLFCSVLFCRQGTSGWLRETGSLLTIGKINSVEMHIETFAFMQNFNIYVRSHCCHQVPHHKFAQLTPW